jgi:high-affinity nickel-transport protein
VVVAGTVLVAVLVQFDGSEGVVKSIGSMIGTSVSAAFLLLIAAVNLAILAGLWRTFCAVRKRGGHEIESVEELSAEHGLLGRLLGPAFRMVTRGWHMYPLGLLFGLGFDTATEFGLLSLSAAEAARRTTVANLLIFPALFTSAMALVDTAVAASCRPQTGPKAAPASRSRCHRPDQDSPASSPGTSGR